MTSSTSMASASREAPPSSPRRVFFLALIFEEEGGTTPLSLLEKEPLFPFPPISFSPRLFIMLLVDFDITKHKCKLRSYEFSRFSFAQLQMSSSRPYI